MAEKWAKTVLEKTKIGVYKPPERRGFINSIQMSMLYPEEREWLKNKGFKSLACIIHAMMHAETRLTKGKKND